MPTSWFRTFSIMVLPYSSAGLVSACHDLDTALEELAEVFSVQQFQVVAVKSPIQDRGAKQCADRCRCSHGQTAATEHARQTGRAEDVARGKDPGQRCPAEMTVGDG